MNTMSKKMYMIPETETLSLGSMHTLMGTPQGGPGGTGNDDPGKPEPGEYSAPRRRVFF